MLRPEHVTASELAHQRQSTRRTISIAAVGALHLVLIWALASGLASNMVAHITEDVKVAVIKEKVDIAKPPPPPPPDFKIPPPDFVPPPEINIQTESTTNAITQVQKAAPTPAAPPPPPAPPKPQGITAPASIGAPHSCPQGKWYPPTAVRLNQEGTTTLSFVIGTDGSIKDPKVAESSGFSSLDDAAIRCVAAGWHYKPALKDGQPVEVPWKALVKWQLSGGH